MWKLHDLVNDASFANLKSGPSPGGSVIFMRGSGKNAPILY